MAGGLTAGTVAAAAGIAAAAAVAANVAAAAIESEVAKREFETELQSLPTRIPTQMVEKEYLLSALKDLGCTFEEGIEIAVTNRLNPISFRKIGETYEYVGPAQMDEKEVAFLKRVAQRYAYHAARAKLEAQGFTLVEEQVEQGQQIRLLLRRIA